MAGQAGRRLIIALLASHSMNALRIAVHSIRMAGRALLRDDLGGLLHFVRLAVATRAGVIAERSVDAFRNLRDFVAVAGGAVRHLHRLGMWILFHALVAGRAPEFAVHAALVFGGVDVEALAGRGLHAGIAVASQTILI